MEKIGRSIPVTRPYKLPLESNGWGGAYDDGEFTGSNISVTDNANFEISNTATIQFTCLLRKQFGDYKKIFQKGGYGVGSYYFDIEAISGSHSMSFLFGAAAPTNFRSVNADNIYQYGLNNIAVTVDIPGDTSNFYINGRLSKTTHSLPVYITSASNLLTTGNQDTVVTIYDTTYYGTVLTQPQIQDLMYGRILPTQFDCRLWHDYRLGHARDQSGNNNHGTINGNVRFV